MKRTYSSPVLEQIIIDKQISMVMMSNGPGGTPENPNFDEGSAPDKKEKDKPMDSPFGE